MSNLKRVLVAVPVLFLVGVLAVATFGWTQDRSSDSKIGTASDSLATDDSDGTADRAESVTKPGRGDPNTISTGAASTQPMNRAVISTGQVALRPESVTRARAEVMRLVASWGGTVADEQSTSDERGRLVESALTLRVPSPRFDEAMNAFAGLGKVADQSRKAEDVTTKVIDNDARVRAAERSIRQIENLLGRAEELRDVIAIEADLARRQADLDSLKSQQAYLADQTALSTINVHLSRTAQAGPADPEERGFLAGLAGGWDALQAATVVLLTVVGAVLPFALVLALLGVPVWLVLRRRAARGPVSGGSAPARSA